LDILLNSLDSCDYTLHGVYFALLSLLITTIKLLLFNSAADLSRSYGMLCWKLRCLDHLQLIL